MFNPSTTFNSDYDLSVFSSTFMLDDNGVWHEETETADELSAQ